MAHQLLALVVLALPASVMGKDTTPRFKWGQTKDQIFLSVMVRDLVEESVAVSLPSSGDLSFKAKDSKGEAYGLELSLREDVDPKSFKFEVVPRPDKWGRTTLVTLSKKNQHRWDLLVTNPKAYKDRIDKDWTREDQALDPEDEVPYVEEHEGYLKPLTANNIDKVRKGASAVLVNIRYPWCTQCKSQDETFAKAAKKAKARGKKDARWKKAVFAVVDAREERNLARKFDAKCDYTCEYKVFADPGEDGDSFKSKWSEDELLTAFDKYLQPAVQAVKSADDVEKIKERNTTCVAGFASDASPKYALFKKVAGAMRGDLMFAATFGEDRPLELWPLNQTSPSTYEGAWEDNGTELLTWIKPRAIPLLQEYDWQLRETYEKLGLPIGKIWIDDSDKNPEFDKIVRHVVRRVAKKLMGKMAFVENKKSMYSYEMRDYGLNQPEVYPAFGVASNASYNAVKYGFEVTPDLAASAQDFWKDADGAIAKLTSVCEQVLAGTWPEAHESGKPQTSWKTGEVKQLVWKTYKEIQNPATPLLLTIRSKYHTDHAKNEKEAENLAKALEPHAASVTVAGYDTSDSYFPPGDFKRERYATDTEWYWVPMAVDGNPRAPAKKLTKPKKEAPIAKVIEFLKKQSGLDIDVEAVTKRFEELMKENPPLTTPPPGAVDEDEDEDEDDEAGGDPAAGGTLVAPADAAAGDGAAAAAPEEKKEL